MELYWMDTSYENKYSYLLDDLCYGLMEVQNKADITNQPIWINILYKECMKNGNSLKLTVTREFILLNEH